MPNWDGPKYLATKTPTRVSVPILYIFPNVDQKILLINIFLVFPIFNIENIIYNTSVIFYRNFKS